MAVTQDELRRALTIHSPSHLSAQAIIKTARLRLWHSPYIDLRSISCKLRGGVLVLEGCVSSYYVKQIAQTTLREIDGVRDIDNRLRVEYQQQWAREARERAT